jgi:hypothetical protein
VAVGCCATWSRSGLSGRSAIAWPTVREKAQVRPVKEAIIGEGHSPWACVQRAPQWPMFGRDTITCWAGCGALPGDVDMLGRQFL